MRLLPRRPGAPGAAGTFPTKWARTAPAVAVRAGLQAVALRPLIRTQVDVRVTGREQLEGLTGPVVFVANHSSHLDTPVILGALPRRWARRTVVAAAADYFFEVWWRAASTALVMNTFPIERRGGTSTRSEDGTLGPFKLGPAYLAVRAGLPVVPISLRGTYAAMPRDSSWPVRGRLPVSVRFGSPVLPGEGETPREFAPRVRDAVVRLTAEDAGTWWEAQRAAPVPAPRKAAPMDAPGRWRAVWGSSRPPERTRRPRVWRR